MSNHNEPDFLTDQVYIFLISLVTSLVYTEYALESFIFVKQK